jgi:hypothetical protein
MKTLRRRSGVVHAFGECKDCGVTFESHKNALALSAKHARDYDHTVEVEQCISVIYNPKGKLA